MKSGFACIYGRANAGKSTIINKRLGFKFLPVSSKPQTTRDIVHAIYNDDDYQIVFVDTPGVFRPHGKLGSILLRDAENAKEGVDVIVYVVDANEVPDFSLANQLAKQDIPVILAFNKIDLVRVNIGHERLNRYLQILPKALPIEISAKEGFGIDTLLEEIKKHRPEGDPIFPTDIVSDRPKEYVISERIREKCRRLLEKEVPHSIAIDVKHVDRDSDPREVYGDIIVEKESEKAIVIGKNGKRISQISKFSEDAIGTYFGKPCYVSLQVKCVPDWRNSDKYLKKFGYEE